MVQGYIPTESKGIDLNILLAVSANCGASANFGYLSCR